MFDIHLGRKHGNLIAVVDVGSGSAAVTYIALHPEAPAEVLVAERGTLSIEERSKAAAIAALGECLVQAGEKAAKAYTARTRTSAAPDALYCIIRAPWSHSMNAQASSESENQKKVTDEMIGGLAQKALAAQTKLDRKNMLEATVIRVELNGYPTAEPTGKPAHELAVWALVSDCDPQVRAQVQTSLQTLFPHLKPAFRSGTRATLSILHERPHAGNDYFVVDMGSESTTLINVRDGAIVEQYVVAEGLDGILKRIAPTGMPEDTLSLIRMLGTEQCSSAACEAIQSAMAKIEPELVRAYGEGMAACVATRRLPGKLFLIVRPEMADWLARFFSRIDFTQFTLTTQPFAVETVTPKDFSQWIVPGKEVTLDTESALFAALAVKEERS